ncbi:MAG: recombination protein RecR [Candidatus Levybacteria bacterium]|nr:recombination protein RecR [Candidatus Levybacteria bacterium]
MKIPKAIQHVIEAFERLPGVGSKTAQRLTFYLLHVPQGELDRFAEVVQNLKRETVMCSICKSVDEQDPCSICSDPERDKRIICVVEQPLDVLALEKSSRYKGVYHVLHGKIDPLNNIGPDEIFIRNLFDRVQSNVILGSPSTSLRINSATPGSNDSGQVPTNRDPDIVGARMTIDEIILATNPTMEGEATAMYIAKQLKTQNSKLKITRIGRGLPIGSDLEYADSTTLDRAMDGRSTY